MDSETTPTDLHSATGAGSLPSAGSARHLGSAEFLSCFAHELRTPLQVVLGYAELLGRESLAPDPREAVEAIQSASRFLLDLAADVLDLAVCESGHLALRLEAVDCSALLGDVSRLIKPVAAAKAVSVSTEAVSVPVLVDRRRVVQILLNLLTNSVNFSPNGGTITLSCSGPEGGRVRFEVRDSGPGIPAEGLTRIFKPFERLQPGLPGSGLGLAICQSLVAEMGGTIRVTSSDGSGSTFWFELPEAESEVASFARRATRQADAGSLCA